MPKVAPVLVKSFPWSELRPVAPSGLRRGRALASLPWSEPPPLELVEATLSELLEAPVMVRPEPPADGPAPLAHPRGFRLRGWPLDARLVVGSELALEVAGRLLRREPSFHRPDLRLEPALLAPVAATASELARRLGVTPAPQLLPEAASEPGDAHFEADFHLPWSLVIGGRSHLLALELQDAQLPPPVASGPTLLRQLADTPLAVPVVIGQCSLTAAELDALSVGEAIDCGAGWLIDPAGRGQALLVPAGGEWGWALELDGQGQAVLGSGARELPWTADDEESDMARTSENSDEQVGPVEAAAATSVPGAAGDEAPTPASLMLEAPIVARVELGTVSMPAREWAELQPGDVVASDQALGRLAVLRVAGGEFARGELVTVEGRLAVRVSELPGKVSTS